MSGTDWDTVAITPGDSMPKPVIDWGTVKLHVDDTITRIFSGEAKFTVPSPPTATEIVRLVAEYSARLSYQPPPPVRAEAGPGVLDKLRAAAPSPAPPAQLLTTLFNIPIFEVFVLARDAWQLVDAKGHVLSGWPTIPKRCDCPLTEVTALGQHERSYLLGDPTGCPVHHPSNPTRTA